MTDRAKLIAGLTPQQRELFLARLNEIEAIAGRPAHSPIQPQARISNTCALSFAQQRLWFLDQLEPDTAVYNLPYSIRLTGALDVAALERALNALVQRHEILRTTISVADGQPIQVIAPTLHVPLAVVDLQGLAAPIRETAAQQLTAQISSSRFSLAQGPLFRICLLKLAEADYLLALTLHHIVCDIWSLDIIVRELVAFYQSFLQGSAFPYPRLPIQYADFALWQRQWLSGEILEQQLAYWRQQLRDSPPALELPTDRPRLATPTYRGSAQPVEIGPDLTQALKALSRQAGTTLFMTLLAAFQTLLSRYTGQIDILVGTPIAGRHRDEIQGLIGFFVNTLVMRTNLSGQPSFLELLGRVREVALAAYEYQDLPFEKLVEELHPQRDLSRNPLFQVMFALQNDPISPLKVPGLSLTPVEVDHGQVQFDLVLSLLDQGSELTGTLEFSTDLFNPSTIARMIEHWKTLLVNAVAAPQQKISEIPLLTVAEENQTLIDWNRTQVDFLSVPGVHALFETQAKQTPDAVAAVYHDQHLTYHELERRASQLAAYLSAKGVGPEILVGLCLERSLELAVGLLGILKAGGAYVPLDPALPKARLTFMLEDAQLTFLLTQERLRHILSDCTATVLCLDTEWILIATPPSPCSEVDLSADNLACVIYTSGSTGLPKGILVTHRGLVNHSQAIADAYQIQSDDRVLQFTSISFDVMAEELFPTWSRGAAVVLRPNNALISPLELESFLVAEELTVVNLPTSYWHEWVTVLAPSSQLGLASLRLVIVGTEEALRERFLIWQQHVGEGVIWQNAYGLTEATITTTLYQPSSAEPAQHPTAIPIGRPIANTQLYLLDSEQRQPVPLGVLGELHIAGEGLTRGYLNHPELTAEKFIPNPFSDKPGTRLCRTGDLARYRSDGNLELAGRRDHQFKIRGYRIELGEIEEVLRRHEDISEAVVVVQGKVPAPQALAAYVIPRKIESMTLWPATGDYLVYDDFLYYAMTRDECRNDSYKAAIGRLVKNKVVLDIGTGQDAILARLCVEAGARQVYAVEVLEPAYRAAQACLESLGLQDKVTLIQGDSREVVLPELVDVCVSDVFGSIGGSEGAACILYDARRFLKADGTMIPQRSLTRIAAVSLPQEFSADPGFSPVGADYVEKIFTRMGHRFDLRLCLSGLSPKLLISSTGVFEDLEIGVSQPEYTRHVKLTITRSGWLDGFAVWLTLETMATEQLDTLEQKCNWLPVYLPVFSPRVEVALGDVIEMTIQGQLSSNRLNPDYRVVGKLVQSNGQVLEFADISYGDDHAPYRHTPFYEALFAADLIKISPEHQVSLTPSVLKEYLKQYLPAYMVPSSFTSLTAWPLLSNGKVDRQKLAAQEPVGPEPSPAIPLQTPIKELIIGIWQDLLHLPHIDPVDNFFDLGGHSLLATQVVSRLRAVFQIELPLQVFFENSTVSRLADYIAAARQRAASQQSLPLVPSLDERRLWASFAQQRLYFLNQLEPDSPVYNMPFAIRLTGQLRIATLEQSLTKITQRHAILRTTFALRDDHLVQVVSPGQPLTLPVVDLSFCAADEQEREVRRLASEVARLPFHLARGPLLRFQLLHLSEAEHVLLMAIHHIVCDDWSVGVFVRELVELYQASAVGQVPPLPILPLQFADYAFWQRQQLQGDRLDQLEAYWRQKLEGVTPVLQLPTDRPRFVLQSFKGAVQEFCLPRDLSEKFRNLCRHEDVTLFMGLLATFKVLLHRYSTQDDIVIGAPSANRQQLDLENLIGDFHNMLVLRTDLAGNPTFRDLLQRVRATTLEAYDHQDLPLEKIVELIRPDRDPGRNPLFQVAFNMLNTPWSSFTLPGLQVSQVKIETQTSRFDMAMTVVDDEAALRGEIEYSTELFDMSTMTRLLGHFRQLLTAIVAEPECRIDNLPLLTEDERAQLLGEWDQPLTRYPQSLCLHELFEDQARQSPDAVAVLLDDVCLSYRELDQRASQLARYLQRQGVGPDVLVGLCLEPSLDMIVSILGVLKAGGAYLPVDTHYPPDRVLAMLEDSQAAVLLTQAALVKDIPFTRLQNLRDISADLIATAGRSQIRDLDALPFPNRNLVKQGKYDQYIGEGCVKRKISIMATRGCPYECLYCHTIWPKVHASRSAQNIFQEVQWHYHNGYNTFAFLDDAFNLNRKNSEAFFELVIKHGLKLRLLFPNGLRGDILTPDYIDLMSAAGVMQLALALETASPRLQRLIQKNLDVERLHANLVYICEKHPHIVLDLFTMFGFPSETEEEAYLTLDFIKGIKWLHFPLIYTLRIFPNTGMARLALQSGVMQEAIEQAAHLPYHEPSNLLPFSKSFVRQYQANFMKEYFLLPERLESVVAAQKRVLTREEITARYEAYLPGGLKSYPEILQLIGEEGFYLEDSRDVGAPAVSYLPVASTSGAFEPTAPLPEKPLRILLLDLSQHFSSAAEQLSNMVEAPLGLLYLLTYLQQKLGPKIHGKILKAMIDFDSFAELKDLIDDFQPQVVGVRTLSLFKNFFHEAVSLIKQWCPTASIVTGGPYATSEYTTLLSDRNVDIVVCGEGELTFCELIERILENSGKLPDDDVLKQVAGLVFVPQQAKVIGQAARLDRKVLLVDEIKDLVAQESSEPLAGNSKVTNLAYVIYTSGSTGRPKGVMVSHENVARLHAATQPWYGFNTRDIWTLFHSYAFDFSVWEIWGALVHGGRLVIIPYELSRAPEAFYKLLGNEQVTVLNQTPSAFRYLIQADQLLGRTVTLALRLIIFGGEALELSGLRSWYEHHGDQTPQLVNMYGITETTVHVTYRPLNLNDLVAAPGSVIGEPIPDLCLYILDRYLQPVPIGVGGEIYVGGAGVARGYLNHPDLTAERFVPSPFGLESGARLYKSGDSGRYLPNGDIEYLGRIDHQVKIRGFRIELGEIEAQLIQHSGIREAIVLAHEDESKHKQLVAYLVLNREQNFTTDDIRGFLRGQLPEYMVPSVFVILDALPLTPNGKLNRRALPVPNRAQSEAAATLAWPSTPVEQRLAQIWAEILGSKPIGVHDNFFALGGDSILSIRVVSAAQKHGLDFSVQQLYQYPTIHELAQKIEKRQPTSEATKPLAPFSLLSEKDRAELSNF